MLFQIKKIFFRGYNDFIKSSHSLVNSLLLFLSFIFLFSCLAAVASSISINSSPTGLLAQTSNDLENAVGVASRTTFYNVNFFFPYGPLFYRIIDFMNEFSPNVHFIDAIASSKSKTVAEDEMSNHFYLVYLSATVPFIIGFLIGFITKVNLAGKFILSAIIGTALLYTQGWGNEIFIGHPDVLLSVVTVLIPFYIMKAIKTNSFHSSSFKLAALIGFGMSIKFSFVTFIPSILLSKYNGNFKIFMRSFFYILIVSLIFYFIIGFPQNFISIPSIIKFLFFQSSISIAPNFESIARWILLIYNDLKYTLPLTIFLIFFLSNNTELEKDKINRLNLKLISWLLLILILPILLLFYQNYVHHVGIGAADHYVLPYQAFILSSSSLLTIYVKKHSNIATLYF